MSEDYEAWNVRGCDLAKLGGADEAVISAIALRMREILAEFSDREEVFCMLPDALAECLDAVASAVEAEDPAAGFSALLAVAAVAAVGARVHLAGAARAPEPDLRSLN